MLDTAVALKTFFSGFGIPAFQEDNVPETLYDPVKKTDVEVALPYITFELREPEPIGHTVLAANVWYDGTDYAQIAAKVDQIKAAVITDGQSGVVIEAGDGAIALWPETDFCQFVTQEDDKIKCAHLMFEMAAYKM